jgi:hypothetical protein
VGPFILGIHGDPAVSAFAAPGMGVAAAPWAVGAWLRGVAGLQAAGRPLADPVVLMSCGAARSAREIADQTGRLVWAPAGGISVGAEPVSLADRSAGVRAVVTLHRTADGRPGRFGSAWPQGPAGDRVRHACRVRPGNAGIGWLAGHLAPEGTAAPAAAGPAPISGYGRFFGWSFFDERDRESRRAALRPARIASSYVTWAPSGGYQPGTPRQLDPRTGGIAGQAEPWQVTGRGALPFDPGGVLWAAGYFARGRFLVTGPGDVTYLEEPLDFGRRLGRERDAARPRPGRARWCC